MKTLLHSPVPFSLKISNSQLSSAIYDKVLDDISASNDSIKMLVCLIGGYYDIGAWNYMEIMFP
jgi:hypothetical protein